MRYATLRNLHGSLALALSALLGVYVASGWLIVRGVSFGSPVETVLSVPVESVRGEDEDVRRVRDVAVRAAERAGLEAARVRAPKFRDGAWHVRVARVARSADVTLAPGTLDAKVVLRVAKASDALAQLHHIPAKNASGWRLAWAILVDALAVGLLTFAVSGIWLFVRVKRDRRLGWALLGAAAAYSLGGIAWLALAR